MASTAELLVHARLINQTSAPLKEIRAEFEALKLSVAASGVQTAEQAKQLDVLARQATRTDAAIGGAARAMGNLGSKMSWLITLPVGYFFYKSAQAAGDYAETINKVSVAFDRNVKAIDMVNKATAGSAKNYGLSKTQVLDYTSSFGALLRGTGTDSVTRADMAINLTRRASDLASLWNTSVEEALGAVQSGLGGEIRPMRERSGTFLTEDLVKSTAKSMGNWDGTGTMSQSAGMLARYRLMIDQTSYAQGDFARTADTAANRQRILSAQFKDLQVTVGQKLIPVWMRFLQAGQIAISMFTSMPGALQLTAIGFMGLVAVVGPVLKLVSTLYELRKAIIAVRIAQAASGGAGGLLGGLGGGLLGGAALGPAGWTALGVGAVALGGYGVKKWLDNNHEADIRNWASEGIGVVDKSDLGSVQGGLAKARSMLDEQAKAKAEYQRLRANLKAKAGKYGPNGEVPPEGAQNAVSMMDSFAGLSEEKITALRDKASELADTESTLMAQIAKTNAEMGITNDIRARIDAYDDLTKKIDASKQAMNYSFGRFISADQSALALQAATAGVLSDNTKGFSSNAAKQEGILTLARSAQSYAEQMAAGGFIGSDEASLRAGTAFAFKSAVIQAHISLDDSQVQAYIDNLNRDPVTIPVQLKPLPNLDYIVNPEMAYDGERR